MRDVGPLDAVKESARLLKSTWGENIIGQGGVGVVFGLAQFLVILLTMTIAAVLFSGEHLALAATAIGIGVVVMMAFALVQAALSGIYSAALYRHAADLAPSPGFDGALLTHAFVPKRK